MQTTAFTAFIEANPADPRVVRIMRLLDNGFTLNGKVGRLIGELMREVAAA